MITNRTLQLAFTGSLEAKYRRTDVQIDPTSNNGNVKYNDLKFLWNNGSGRERVDLFHAQRYNLNNSVLLIDLDADLQNIWNDTLNFDSIKFIAIKNRSEETGAFLQVRLKDDRYYIGPGGSRVLIEPWGMGLSSIISSSSSEEGTLIFSTDFAIEFDFIIGGSSQEQSSSSSGL